MMKKIWMYLFLFTALWVVFQYVNSTKIYDDQDRKLTRLQQKFDKASDSLAKTITRWEDEKYFSLKGNDNAYVYFQNEGIDPEQLESKLIDAVMTNNTKNGNELIPFEGVVPPFRMNKIKVLNHQWIIADFSNGKRWGEVLLRYYVNDSKSFEFEVIKSMVYPE